MLRLSYNKKPKIKNQKTKQIGSLFGFFVFYHWLFLASHVSPNSKTADCGLPVGLIEEITANLFSLRKFLTTFLLFTGKVYQKKEFEAKVRTDGLFGKQEFYLVAKDKKSVSEKDFEGVWEKAHKKRLQALFLSPGELNKKAKEHLREWNNLVKFEKLGV